MSERDHQQALIEWCRRSLPIYPDLRWIHHSPNGGKHLPQYRSTLNKLGVSNGFPDILLLVPRGKFHGLLFELKFAKRKMFLEQRLWRDHCIKNSYYHAVHYDWRDAAADLEKYLKLK